MRVAEIVNFQLDAVQLGILVRLESGRGKILTPYKIWIHSAGVANGMEVLGTYLNTNGCISEAEREIAILMTAVFWKSPFVIHAHTRHSRTSGIDERAIEALLEGRRATFSDERQQAVHELVTDALQSGGSIEDETFRRYETILGRGGIAQFISLVGYFTSVSLAMRMHEVLPVSS